MHDYKLLQWVLKLWFDNFLFWLPVALIVWLPCAMVGFLVGLLKSHIGKPKK